MFFSAFHTQHYAAKLASIRARLEFAPQVNMLIMEPTNENRGA
jgi:hypothetical protein